MRRYHFKIFCNFYLAAIEVEDRKKTLSVRILCSLSVVGGVSSTTKALDELTEERPTKSVPSEEIIRKNELQ